MGVDRPLRASSNNDNVGISFRKYHNPYDEQKKGRVPINEETWRLANKVNKLADELYLKVQDLTKIVRESHPIGDHTLRFLLDPEYGPCFNLSSQTIPKIVYLINRLEQMVETKNKILKKKKLNPLTYYPKIYRGNHTRHIRKQNKTKDTDIL